MNKIKNLAAILLLLNLSGCLNVPDNSTASDTSDNYDFSPVTSNEEVNLKSFSVSSSNSNNGVAEINAGINNGAFSIAWNVPAPSPYHVRLYLSENDTLEESKDIKFFQRNCGNSYSYFSSQCTDTGNYNCKFTSDNKISCGVVSTSYDEKNISWFLDQIPKKAWLILNVCNAFISGCKNQSQPVEFQ